MPTHLSPGTWTQEGYDTMEKGPGYDWVAIVDFPSDEAAAQVADPYARTVEIGCSPK